MEKTIIRNAQVIDGSGRPRFSADVLIAGDGIVDVGSCPGDAVDRVIDAGGKVLAPGFIDMHSHADFSLPLRPTADSLVHQGITTVVIGQCGLSPAPLIQDSKDAVVAALGGFFGEMAQAIPWEKWTSLAEYLDYLTAQGVAVNVVPLVGQGIIRASVMGFAEGRADKGQMDRMQKELSRAFDDGAFGLSTGLIYPPGSFTSTEELVELVRVVGDRGRHYFSHIRGESETLLDAVKEAILIGRRTGAAVQVSHFKAAQMENWDKSQPALALIEEANAQGLDVGTDLYPYTAGSTSLGTLLPEWAHAGGPDETLARLRDPALRERMTMEMQSGGFAKGVTWDKVLITSSPANTSYEGLYVDDLAAQTGQTGYERLFDVLVETRLDVGMALFGMSRENRINELKYPGMMIGTDGQGLATEGLLAQGIPHPRSYGAFPRVLARYVREMNVLTLEEAVHRMTGLAAKKLGLEDRGEIKPGNTADLVLFDPQKIKDRATYDKPHQYAEGIARVFVNGRPVIEEEAHTGATPGRVLTCP